MTNDIYTLTSVTDFSASHIIPGHPGKCARLHGHNWKVEISVRAKALDHLGMGVDFQVIKDVAKDIIEKVDHYHLNDLEDFKEIMPTAENIARWLYNKAAEKLNTDAVQVHAVTLWETDRSRVQYHQETRHD